MKAIWTVAQRELRSYFDHPTGYILLVAFIGVNNFLFFRQAYLVDVASLRPMLDLLPWVLLFLVPAVTMRSVAEDRKSGTVEIVLAQPITDLELLLGKYAGALLFLWIALALTLPIPMGLSLGADLAMGVILAQYFGAALFLGGLTAIGLWASSLTANQISAFIIAVATMFVLVLLGLSPMLVGLPPTLGAMAARLSILTHFSNIGRGVIDLRDAVYFVSVAAAFIMLAYGTFVGRRLAPRGDARKRLRMGVTGLVAVVVLVNLMGRYIGGRLDLTPGKAYTLSTATAQLVSGLDENVTIKLFISKELPPEIALMKRDLDDLLSDLRSAGKGNVRVVIRDPAEDEEARTEAESLGVPKIQFNVVGESQLQIREGYIGMAIQYADGLETIPIIRGTDDLEYRIAAAVRGMSRSDTAVVAIVTGLPDPALPRNYQALETQLRDSYQVRRLSIPTDGEPGDDVDVVILAGDPDSLPADQLDRIKAFVARGGGLMVLASGMRFDQQQPVAQPRPIPWNVLLADYGVTIRSDMVYDLRSNERVGMNSQLGRLFVSYPFWVRASSTGASSINRDIGTIMLPWPSSIDVSGADSGAVTPLYASTQAAGVSATVTFLDPQRQFQTDSLASRLLAVTVNMAELGAEVRGRLVVVGNEEFLTDRRVGSAPENLLFALNAVDWLAQDEGLVQIRAKDRRPPSLVLSDGKRDGVKYANVIGIPILIGLMAVFRLLRRRRLTRRVYHVAGEGA